MIARGEHRPASLSLFGVALAVILLGAAALPQNSHHQPEELAVQLTVSVSARNGDLDASLAAAEDEARREGLASVVRTLARGLSQEEIAKIAKRVLMRSPDRVRVIVLDHYLRDQEYVLEAEVVVAIDPVVDALSERGVRRDWRVMIVIPEYHINAPIPDPAAETEMIRQFIAAGYKVIDQSRYAELRWNVMEQWDDPTAAAALGRKMGADVLITGEAFSQRNPSLMGMVSCRARVEARAILADSAEIIAADAVHAAGADVVESVAAKKALQEGGAKLALLFIRDLSRLPDPVRRTMRIEVGVFPSFASAARFEAALESLAGVDHVSREGYDDGVLALEVDASAESADELAVKLEENKLFLQFRLKVTAVSRTLIRAHLAMASEAQ